MAERYSLLFVDDEPNILQGLSRMLRVMRNEWDTHFATGGEEALALLATTNIDVLITDMRMPGMDGAELLSIVRDKYPDIVRIILSGHSETSSILKCVKPAHQFLTKPCQSDKLISTIQNACCLRELLQSKLLRKIITHIEYLPAASNCYKEITDEINSENPSLDVIGRIISNDVGMSASLLKLVNSSFFGSTRKITNPTQAVTMLGLDVVKSLILSVLVWSKFKQEDQPGLSVSELWDHSMRVAGYAKTIALQQKAPSEMVELCFIAGLMHDLGKLVLAMKLPIKYAHVVEQTLCGNRPLWLVEKELLGANHGEAGAYLLGLWGTSAQVVKAVANHHEPRKSTDQAFSILTAVHVADIMDHKMTRTPGKPPPPPPDWEYLERIGATGDFITWTALIEGEHAKENNAPGGPQ